MLPEVAPMVGFGGMVVVAGDQAPKWP